MSDQLTQRERTIIDYFCALGVEILLHFVHCTYLVRERRVNAITLALDMSLSLSMLWQWYALIL